MNKKLYKLLDWAKIEGIVYSDEDHPSEILGPHLVKGGVLIQAFFPNAKSVTVVLDKGTKKYAMLPVDYDGDYDGFYAVLIPETKLFSYYYEVTISKKETVCLKDPYAFEPLIDAADQKRFNSGIAWNIYKKLGAHVTKVDGISGTDFAVWAPNAVRVSVVGDFNGWDGRRHPMNRVGESGIFELFIPGVSEGELYKFEIRQSNQEIVMKADPYGFQMENCPDAASIIYDFGRYSWEDKEWLARRGEKAAKDAPVFIYEVHLGSFKKPDSGSGKDFYNYSELAPFVLSHVKKMNYTHVELMPVMEHRYDESLGYEVTGYYATTSRYGTPEDLKYFINYMHKGGIGVILDWVPAYFSKEGCGLGKFDGTCLYEHLDPKKGVHAELGTYIFNYKRPEVRNFLIANALFWLKEFHADGLRINDVASMLYLDYGRAQGQWIPNMYGGNENLEAVDFIKDLNNICHKESKGSIMIAEETSGWPKTTSPTKEDGLGFDYKWNCEWLKDFLDYMRCDPLFRKGRHGELTLSMLYHYSENYVLAVPHSEVMYQKGSLLNKMHGKLDEQFANLRLFYGYMMAHPGKKQLFMGQEFAQFSDWDVSGEIDWELDEYKYNHSMMKYVAALGELYRAHPALYELDYETEGFEWISCLDADHSILAFVRKSSKEQLLILCNFTPVVYTNYQIGVPIAGKYKEIFNSDAEEFCGYGYVNGKMKQSKKEAWENLENSIKITLPPLGISIFSVTPFDKKPEEEKK